MIMEKYDGINTILEKIKDSPIARQEYYHTMMYLCGAIKNIAELTFSTMDDIRIAAKNGSPSLHEYIGKAQEAQCQIMVLSEVIDEKVNSHDFVDILNLIHY